MTRTADFAYLDHAATTPLCAAAREAMLEFADERFANPSGAHWMARDAMRAVNDARDKVAELFGAQPGEVVFLQWCDRGRQSGGVWGGAGCGGRWFGHCLFGH